MRRRLLVVVFALVALLVTGCDLRLTTPTGDAPLRYRDAVFASVAKTADVVYGQAPDQQGNQVTLKLDLYEPVGDTVTARQRPVVIVTSNAEKELPDAFLRRCVFHYIAFPDPEQMAEIVRVHHPNLQDDLLRAAIEAFYVVRQMDGLAKRPSTSELVDWVQALVVGGIPAERVVEELPFLGVVLKKPQDLEVARRHLAVRAQRGAGVQRRLRDG